MVGFSDSAYADVSFDGYQPPSFLAAPGAIDVGVEFTTMSKGYNMAGWRVGFCAGNSKMVQALATIKGYYDYGMFAPIQIASVIAMRECGAAVRDGVGQELPGRGVVDPIRELLLMPGRHGQQVTHPHPPQVGAGIRRRILGEELQHLVVQRKASLGNRQPDGGRGEALAQGIELVRRRGLVRPPPSLGHHPAMAHHHHAVERVQRLSRLDKLQEGPGGNPLGLRDGTRQRRGRRVSGGRGAQGAEEHDQGEDHGE